MMLNKLDNYVIIKYGHVIIIKNIVKHNIRYGLIMDGPKYNKL